MTFTQGFDGSTASGIALAQKLAQERARVSAAVAQANANYAAWNAPPGFYNPRITPKKVEPQLTFKPETPAETRIHTAASKRGWANRPAPAGEVHFIREGARDVVVTRDALKRVPILADTVVRQLENS
jgi:hypothetical protein